MITLILKDTVNDRDWSLQTEAEVLLIGRNRDAQVCIRDRSVSKNHCRIEKRGASYRFKDLKSRNGTYINDLRCDGGPIENGDELKVGNFVILFQTSEGAAQAPAAATPSPFDQPPGEFDLDEDFDALMDDATMVDPAGGNPFLDPAPAAPAAAGPPGQPGVTPPQVEPPQQMPPQQAQQQMPPQQQQPQQQMPPQQQQPQQQMPPQQQQPLQLGGDLGFETPLEQGPAPGTGSSKFSKPTSKYARRRKTRPELELEDELFGTEDPLRKPSRAKGKWDTAHVALFVIFSLLLGLALGVLLARVMKSAPPPAEPPVMGSKLQPVPGAPQPANPASQTATATPQAPAAPKPLDPALEPLLGKRADLGDSETSSRHCIRLFLDSLNRSPTREELTKYRRLSHQERWNAIQVLARSEGSAIPLKYVSLAQIYLGPDRLPTAKEKDHLMVQTSGTPERIGYTIISSKLYSSAEFTRDRTLPQRARSLLVDLRDNVPKESDVTDVTDLLETENADPKEILEVLLENSAGPSGGNTDQWIEESYLRFLLRSPTAAETNEARSKINGAENGWREVILSLTLQQGYQSY